MKKIIIINLQRYKLMKSIEGRINSIFAIMIIIAVSFLSTFLSNFLSTFSSTVLSTVLSAVLSTVFKCCASFTRIRFQRETVYDNV